MTVTIGWWLMPTIITIAAFVWAVMPRDNERHDVSMFSGMGRAIGLMLRGPMALAFSLAAWLVWSLL